MMDKEYIISEIKRTAEKNGGNPLGIGKFFQATGIKTTDWKGIHWARWGDAVRQAGFEPNTLQKGFGKKHLINKHIELIRELGRFPVDAELSLKRQGDKNFPSLVTFRKNLGRKSIRAARILEFCKANDGFEDVISICEPIAIQHQQETVVNDMEDEVKSGWVYLAKIGKKYKIGHTYSLPRREFELGNQSPEKFRYLHTIETDDPIEIEKYWHRKFESKLIKNEFYNLTQSDVKAFKKWKRII